MNYYDTEDFVSKYNGNRFAAAVDLAQKARSLRIQYKYVISESEAISAVLSGSLPKDINSRLEREKRNRSTLDNMVRETCCYLDDKDLCKALKSSIKLSKKLGYICYSYGDLQSSYKQARLRILVNQIWYEVLDNKRK